MIKFTELFLGSFGVLLIVQIYNNGRVSGDLGADPMSTMRILKELCETPGGHDELFAKQFYACYGKLPEKEKCLVDKCQKKHWGGVLNTKSILEGGVCMNLPNLTPYFGCLMQEFAACGLDTVKALTTVNLDFKLIWCFFGVSKLYEFDNMKNALHGINMFGFKCLIDLPRTFVGAGVIKSQSCQRQHK